MPSVETDLDNERREVWTEWIMERKYFHEIPTLEGRPGNAFFVPNSKNRSDQIFERGEESEVLTHVLTKREYKLGSVFSS
jgi:hypothetical protein